MDPYNFAVQKAEEAGELLLAAQERGFETLAKEGDPRNIVTSADLAVNDFLLAELRKEFPADSVYSEEGGSAAGGERVWALDPLDGSSNFSRGIPHYAVCIALLAQGAPAAGAVYNPATRELFSFKKGGGAFLNGAPIRVSGVTAVSEAFVFLHAGRKKELWDWGGAAYRRLLEHGHKTSNFAGSALDLCFVAAGRIEASVYGTLSALDIAAALGILAEAGGIVLAASGEPARLSSEPQKLYAANGEPLARRLIDLLER